MKQINLTKEKIALVDEEDFEYLNQWKWRVDNYGYAIRVIYLKRVNKKYKRQYIWMHRLINKTPNNLFTDHINRDKLDNRRGNLRTVTKEQNNRNKDLDKKNKSGFKGVYWIKRDKKYGAYISVNNKTVSLGHYKSIQTACLARKWGERLYWN